METLKVVSGDSLEEAWNQIRKDFSENPDLFEYNATIDHLGRSVLLNIDIDLGGGFEGGYALTRFVSTLKNFDDFKFEIHRQDLVDGIGKFFGKKDIVLGFSDFDKMMVIHTNQLSRLRELMSEEFVRQTLMDLPEFSFAILHHHHADQGVAESVSLELRIDEGITDPEELLRIYHAFISVLNRLELDDKSIIEYL